MKTFNQNLGTGTLSREVYDLQDTLELLGYGDFVPTGFYGTKTERAVMKFQIDNQIQPVSGYFGPITRGVMNSILASFNRKHLYRTAVSCLGSDASPSDIAPDEYGCAETVSNILLKSGVDMPVFLSTYQLYKFLDGNPSVFIRTDSPLEGDVIISPSGYGNGKLTNGHTGIVGLNGEVMSNSSTTGNFERNYTLKSWKDRYVTKGGYPVFYFRRL